MSELIATTGSQRSLTEDEVYSNVDHVLNQDVVKELEAGTKQAQHAAYDFCGYVYKDENGWHEEVWDPTCSSSNAFRRERGRLYSPGKSGVRKRMSELIATWWEKVTRSVVVKGQQCVASHWQKRTRQISEADYLELARVQPLMNGETVAVFTRVLGIGRAVCIWKLSVERTGGIPPIKSVDTNFPTIGEKSN